MFIWFIWLIWFIWFNQINQTNETNRSQPLEAPLELEAKQVSGLQLIGGLGTYDIESRIGAGGWGEGGVRRASLSPGIGNGQFERAIELIFDSQLCFPHRRSRRITLKLAPSEIFLHSHIGENVLAIGIAFIVIKELDIAAMHGAEFHRCPGPVQLRPPPDVIFRLKAERLRKDDHMPGNPFVEIIAAVRNLRRNRNSYRQDGSVGTTGDVETKTCPV